MNQAVEDPKSAIVFSKKSPGVLNMKPSEAKSLPAWDAALGNASAHEQHSLSTSRTRAQRPCKRLEGCPSQICTRTPAKRTIDSARRCENRLDPKPVSVCACVRVLLQLFCVSPPELECHMHLALQFGTPGPTPESAPPVLNFGSDVTLRLQSE